MGKVLSYPALLSVKKSIETLLKPEAAFSHLSYGRAPFLTYLMGEREKKEEYSHKPP